MKPILTQTRKLFLQNRLILSQKMRLTIQVLQLAQDQLKELIEQEIEKNPLIEEIDSNNLVRDNIYYKKMTCSPDPIEMIEKSTSLFEYLSFQAKLSIKNEDLKIAEFIIGNLDQRGFLNLSIEEIQTTLKIKKNKIEEVLKIIQTFDPIGIAAKDFRDSLMIQMRHQKKENSLIFKLIDQHFDNLINNRWNQISYELCISIVEIKKVFKELKSLNLDLTAPFIEEKNLLQAPDISLEHDGRWKIKIEDALLPKFKISNFSFTKEEMKFVKNHILSGKMLLQAIENRKKMLFQIMKFIIKKQSMFLLSEGALLPLSYKEIASELNVHISTISRAIANKFVKCPSGTFSLKSFFQSLVNEEISSQKALAILKKIIQEEDKTEPFSDDKISCKIKQLGISISRRTISKYRKKLKIPSAKKRKAF